MESSPEVQIDVENKYSTTSKEASSVKLVNMKKLANSQINIGLLMTSVHVKQELATEFNYKRNQMNQRQLGSLFQVKPEMTAEGVQDSAGREGYQKHGSTQVFLHKNLKKRGINDNVVFSLSKVIRRSVRLQNKRELRPPATPAAEYKMIRQEELPITDRSL